jgi:hypothetical protein
MIAELWVIDPRTLVITGGVSSSPGGKVVEVVVEVEVVVVGVPVTSR